MITIYSTSVCPRCKILKDAFQKAGIPYEEKPLDSATIADVLCETGILVQSAPLVQDNAVYFFADDLFDSGGNLITDWRKVLEGIRPHKEFGGLGGQPDENVRSSSKIWGD
jgi:hypothetical protein